jgi:hypothetical protein
MGSALLGLVAHWRRGRNRRADGQRRGVMRHEVIRNVGPSIATALLTSGV